MLVAVCVACSSMCSVSLHLWRVAACVTHPPFFFGVKLYSGVNITLSMYLAHQLNTASPVPHLLLI